MTQTLDCLDCGDPYPKARYKALKPARACQYCKTCAEHIPPPIRTVAHINKSNPMLITDMSLLAQLNPKRT